MTMENLLSIIIPVYNTEKYLSQCLESVCCQTYKNLEIILVNDGSTDGSGHICEEWSRRDGRIRVIHKDNAGVSSARNDGLEAAMGDFIGFVDSDDWIEPEMYEKLLAVLDDADMACCGYADYPLDTLGFSVAKGVKPSASCNPLKAALNIYERDGYFTAIWNKLYRKGSLYKDRELIRMDENLSWGEDEVWLAQVLQNISKVNFLPEALYHWRPTEVSATRNSVVTDRQMTLLKAKQRSMEILPQEAELQNLVRARMFNDCYSLKVLAYVSGDQKKYGVISRVLAPYKSIWVRSNDLSPIRKMKVIMLEIEMALHMPGKIVQRTDNVRRYGIKR